jgi:hypothetical protein
VAGSEDFNCVVTSAGLKARASAFGVPVEQLPPPDGLLRPGDEYQSSTGCATGDIVTQSATGQHASSGGGGGRSPVAVGVVLFLVLIIAVLIAYFVVRRTKMRQLEREEFLQAELREDRSRGRL